jgi:diacylglycerol kinase family enzyme
MDFARNVGAKRGHAAAVKRVTRGRELRVDVGFMRDEGRVFVNFMETGLGAAVVARVSHMGDRWPGRLSFFAAALSAAVTESNIRVHVQTDGAFVYEGPAVSVVAANGRYFGGGMKIAPAARMDDGLLDLLILGDLGKLELARQIWKIYPGKHVSHPKVMHLRASAVTVTTRGESLLDLDGELGGKGSCSATVLPRALTVLV